MRWIPGCGAAHPAAPVWLQHSPAECSSAGRCMSYVAAPHGRFAPCPASLCCAAFPAIPPPALPGALPPINNLISVFDDRVLLLPCPLHTSAAFPQDRPSQERILAVASPNNSVAWMVYVQVSCYQPLKLQHFPFDRWAFRLTRWVPLGLRGGLAGARSGRPHPSMLAPAAAAAACTLGRVSWAAPGRHGEPNLPLPPPPERAASTWWWKPRCKTRGGPTTQESNCCHPAPAPQSPREWQASTGAALPCLAWLGAARHNRLGYVACTPSVRAHEKRCAEVSPA